MPVSWRCGLLAVGLLLATPACTPGPQAVKPTTSAVQPAPTPAPPSAPTSPGQPSTPSYGFYTPYGRQTSTVLEPPAGFRPFYLQDVGRHGSRTSTSSASVETVRALCARAKAAATLTSLGAGYCADTARLADVMHRIGYGDLSPLGRREWYRIGVRTVREHAAFFRAAARTDAPLAFVSSDVSRAKRSSDAFRDGISAEQRGLRLRTRVTDDELMRFATPASRPGEAAVTAIEQLPETQAAAADVLRRLFGERSTSLRDARAVWALYAIAPDTGLNLDAYLLPADAAALARLDDAETFYRYGPGVAGTAGYTSAARLRADLLRVIERHAAGGKTMATFRHGHAETVVPLATLLRLGPTSRPLPPGTLFTDGDEGWQAEEQAKMAANIELAAYRKGRSVLVTIRYNEEPVQVRDCRPSPSDAYFYELTTLERCWS